HRLFERRPQLLARPAPGCPEIDDDSGVMRGIDDVGHEALGRAVLDEIGAAIGRPRRGAENGFHCLLSLWKYALRWRRNPPLTSIARHGAARSRSPRSTVTGWCPQCRMKARRSPGATAVVAVLTSG